MTLAQHTPASWDDILSTTFHNYRKTLTDNIFNSRPLLNYYMSKGRLRTVSGGVNMLAGLSSIRRVCIVCRKEGRTGKTARSRPSVRPGESRRPLSGLLPKAVRTVLYGF